MESFFKSTKTVVIMLILVVIMLGILIWANWSSIFPKKEKDEQPKEPIETGSTKVVEDVTEE